MKNIVLINKKIQTKKREYNHFTGERFVKNRRKQIRFGCLYAFW